MGRFEHLKKMMILVMQNGQRDLEVSAAGFLSPLSLVTYKNVIIIIIQIKKGAK